MKYLLIILIASTLLANTCVCFADVSDDCDSSRLVPPNTSIQETIRFGNSGMEEDDDWYEFVIPGNSALLITIECGPGLNIFLDEIFNCDIGRDPVSQNEMGGWEHYILLNRNAVSTTQKLVITGYIPSSLRGDQPYTLRTASFPLDNLVAKIQARCNTCVLNDRFKATVEIDTFRGFGGQIDVFMAVEAFGVVYFLPSFQPWLDAWYNQSLDSDYYYWENTALDFLVTTAFPRFDVVLYAAAYDKTLGRWSNVHTQPVSFR